MASTFYLCRRGARYHYRRRLYLREIVNRPITVPLATADTIGARRLASRLSMKWEMMAMGAFDRTNRGFVKAGELEAVFRAGLDEELGLAMAPHLDNQMAVGTDRRPLRVFEAAYRIAARLLVQINDWSLRAIAPVEMKTGFGWVRAKPACSMAPIAIIPDEIGDAWGDGRIALPLRTELNGERFGEVPGTERMAHGFGELIAHAARTRTLVGGIVIGLGTVSSARHAEFGSSCISERRAIEMIEHDGARPESA